jgi:hypothetical protein
LPVAQALAAEPVPCSGSSSDGSDHKDPGFDFTKGGTTWRATITFPAKINIWNFKADAANVQTAIDNKTLPRTCSQFVVNFDTPTTFTAVTAPGQMSNVGYSPDCKVSEGNPTTTVPLKGRVDVYCLNVGNRIDRYATILIWNPTAQPYGAAYTVLGAGTDTNGEYRFDGFGNDPVNRASGVAIHFEAQK